ncbi:MAG: hypothetical protein EB127_11295, partial [Alphaproteobacteria bacterium]|nr:hypothetical protein [Alphaproteobacteria bacterium]
DGMDQEELINCGTVHRRTNSSSDKHGRFGAGGNIADINLSDMGKVHYISKSKNKLTEVNEMTLDYNVKSYQGYKLHPHEATRKTEDEIWNRFAIDKDNSGTIQIIHSNAEIVNKLKDSLCSSDINESYRFRLGFIYCRQLQLGLKLEVIVEENTHVISPIDCFKFMEIESKNKERMQIEVWSHNPSKSYRFYYKNKDNKTSYIDFSNSKTGKEKHEVPNKNLGEMFGCIQIESTYHSDWRQLIGSDLENMGLNPSTSIPKEQFLNITGGIIIHRNNKKIAQYHLSNAGTSSGLIPYYLCSHHYVTFDANECLDNMFAVMVNKSNLEVGNIMIDLRNTIEKICKKFVNRMQKQYVVQVPVVQVPVVQAPVTQAPTQDPVTQAPTQAHETQAVTQTPIQVAETQSPVTQAPIQVAETQAPIQAPVTQAVTQTPIQVAETQSPIQAPVTQAVTQAPIQVAETQPPETQALVQAPTQINPINPIKPVSTSINVNVKFSKTDKELIVYKIDNNEILFKIPYIGEYSITEKHYNVLLLKLGEKRFLELMEEYKKIGFFECNKIYFS